MPLLTSTFMHDLGFNKKLDIQNKLNLKKLEMLAEQDQIDKVTTAASEAAKEGDEQTYKEEEARLAYLSKLSNLIEQEFDSLKTQLEQFGLMDEEGGRQMSEDAKIALGSK